MMLAVSARRSTSWVLALLVVVGLLASGCTTRTVQGNGETFEFAHWIVILAAIIGIVAVWLSTVVYDPKDNLFAATITMAAGSAFFVVTWFGTNLTVDEEHFESNIPWSNDSVRFGELNELVHELDGGGLNQRTHYLRCVSKGGQDTRVKILFPEAIQRIARNAKARGVTFRETVPPGPHRADAEAD